MGISFINQKYHEDDIYRLSSVRDVTIFQLAEWILNIFCRDKVKPSLPVLFLYTFRRDPLFHIVDFL